jgi:BRCT domain type II-containing protein
VAQATSLDAAGGGVAVLVPAPVWWLGEEEEGCGAKACKHAEMILRPPPGWAGRNEEIRLDGSSAPLRVGRGQFGIASRTVSREHFELKWSKALGSDDVLTQTVQVRHLADNPMRVCTGGELSVLRAGDECTLRPGDTIFIDGKVSEKVAADASNHTHALELHVDARNDCNWQDWEDSDDDDEEEEEDDDAAASDTAGEDTNGDPKCDSALHNGAGLGDTTGSRSAVSVLTRDRAAQDDFATTPLPAPARESAVTRRASAAVTPVGAPAVPVDNSDQSTSEPDAGTASSSQLSTGQLLDGLSMEELAALELAAAQLQPHIQQPVYSALGTSGARLAQTGVEAAPCAPSAPKPLQGLRFAVTGVLEVLTRDECQAMVEKHGGVFQAGGLRKTNRAASGRTTHLIIGTQMDDGRPIQTSSKFQQARRSGIRIVKEDDLFAMVAGRNVSSHHKRSPLARNRRSSSTSATIDRSHSPSEAGSDCFPVAPLPLQAAAVRAAGGYPLSLFPESEIGAAKRRKLEMLAGHLVVLTDDVLHKVGVLRPVLPVADEIESSDDDNCDAIAHEEDESSRLVTSDRRVSFRSGGAGVETVAEVTSPNCTKDAATLTTGGSSDSAPTERLRSASAVSPVGRQRALSASAALRQTDFVLARDVLGLDSSDEERRRIPHEQHSSAHARHGGGCKDTSVRDNEHGSSESPATMRSEAAGSSVHDKGKISASLPDQARPMSPSGHTARSPAHVQNTLQPLQPTRPNQQQPTLGSASPANDHGFDHAVSNASKIRPSMEELDRSNSFVDTVDSSAESVEDTITSKSPLVPESPLLSWNPDAAVVEFGAPRSVASKGAHNRTRAALAESQVLVPETQATQRREQEPLFVPETQRMLDGASAPARTSPLALRAARLCNSRTTDTKQQVLVPETQDTSSCGGSARRALKTDDGGATYDEETSSGRLIGWLSQSVKAAVVMNNSADLIASPMDHRSRGTAEPTLYTASVAFQSGDMDTVEHVEDSSDQDRSPQRDDSPFRTFPGDASPVPRQGNQLSQEHIAKACGRATRGFESGSSSDDDEDSEDGHPQISDALRMRRAELHARTRSNPFSASAVLSMNPTQPELSGLLLANAAPIPQRKRRHGVSPTSRSRAPGRRHRPTFSWTNKTQPHLADRLSQQSEALRGKQLGQKKRNDPKQQRLTSWVAR